MTWLEEVKARLKARTAGEWHVTRMHREGKTWNQIFSTKTRRAIFPEAASSSTFAKHGDCELIAHAPTDLAKAVRLIEEYERALGVISTNGEGRGMGWTPAQDARNALAAGKRIKGE